MSPFFADLRERTDGAVDLREHFAMRACGGISETALAFCRITSANVPDPHSSTASLCVCLRACSIGTDTPLRVERNGITFALPSVRKQPMYVRSESVLFSVSDALGVVVLYSYATVTLGERRAVVRINVIPSVVREPCEHDRRACTCTDNRSRG